MSGFSHEFEKYIFLPSGGISYEPHAWYKNVTSDLVNLLYDESNSNTMFEYYVQIIKRFVKLPVDIENLFLFDFYFLWTTLSTVNIETKSYIIRKGTCFNCNKEKKIIFDFSQATINIFNKNKHEIKEYKKTIKLHDIDYELTFDLRKVKDNLYYIYYTLHDEKIFYNSIFYYVLTQIKNITNLNTKDYFHFLRIIRYEDLLNIFSDLMYYNYSFGFEMEYSYDCSCDKSNHVLLYDDIGLCRIAIEQINKQDKVDYYKSRLETAQLNIIDLNSMMNIPLKDMGIYQEAFSKVKILPRLM